MSKTRFKFNRGILFALLISLLSTSWISGYAYVTYGNGHGTILDNYGNAIEDVKILIYDLSDELVDTEYTRNDGFFRLALDAGTYKLVFDKPGYVSYEETITLKSGTKSYNEDNDPVDMGTIEMMHTLDITTQVLSRVEAPGAVVLFPFTLSNIGSEVETPEFIVESPDGWETRVVDSSGEVAQVQFEKGSMQLALEVTVPKESFTEEDIVLNIVGYTTQSYTFTIKSVAQLENSIEIATDYPSVSMEKDASLSIPITVSNLGQLYETLTLSNVLPEGWDTIYKIGQIEVLSINLDPKETASIIAEVTPLEGLNAGEYQLEFLAL